jgi:mRNA interferase MazF
MPRAFHRGELYWLEPDESRGSVPGVAHPHLVVQDDVFNLSRVSTVVVCALTSNLQRAAEPGNVLLSAGEGGLARQSVVVVSQVSSVAKDALGSLIGALSQARVEQVLDGLRFQQASFFGRERCHGVAPCVARFWHELGDDPLNRLYRLDACCYSPIVSDFRSTHVSARGQVAHATRIPQ